MKSQTFPDGSVAYYYEVGDLVEITKDQYIDNWRCAKAGEWGKVVHVDKQDSLIAFLDVQLVGYSRDKNAFFQSTTVFCWDVKPHEEKDQVKNVNN